jgi:hypothetical protein
MGGGAAKLSQMVFSSSIPLDASPFSGSVTWGSPILEQLDGMDTLDINKTGLLKHIASNYTLHSQHIII